MINIHTLHKNKIVWKHYEMFGGSFFYLIPAGPPLYEDKNGIAYIIPRLENNNDLLKKLKDDIKNGINTLPERYKDNVFESIPGAVY